jgi:hypothetical protein
MTTIGPVHFFRCPHCKTVLKRATFSSGNTFGSTLWSDGYLHAPMMPKAVDATRCPSCSRAFLVEDAEDLGEHWIDDESAPVSHSDAAMAHQADATALSEIVDTPQDPTRLRHLRISMWHEFNHEHRRKDGEATAHRPEGFEENLERLIEMLDDGEDEAKLMKAEALRELGRHAESIAALQDIGSAL